MASSNKHWPSMFKSKPTNTSHHHHHHQWHHDFNSANCLRNPFTAGSGCEERTPEPKPRWNPRPEQIRILESIFNSGMVNPPREEIRRIRVQLQEYGQVGDANVFYWFQNRKSRSKHKQRQLLQNSKSQTPPTPPPVSAAAAPTSSSSSSDKSNSNEKATISHLFELLNSPTASVNQQAPFFQSSGEVLKADPFYFPVVSTGLTQGFCFPDHGPCVADQTVGNALLGELMLMNHGSSKKADDDDDEKMKLNQQIVYGVSGAPNTGDPIVPPSLISTNHMLQGAGLGEPGPPKSTVFINDVCFEVAVGPFNVRDAFGDDAMLVQSSGQPVLMNEWGVTLEPLHHGAFYYLVRANFSPNDRTMDLI